MEQGPPRRFLPRQSGTLLPYLLPIREIREIRGSSFLRVLLCTSSGVEEGVTTDYTDIHG